MVEDIADIAAVIHVRTCGTNTDNVIGGGDVVTGVRAQGRVTVACGVVGEGALAGAPAPMAVLKLPEVTLRSEYIPTPVLYMPVVRLKRALAPSAVLPPG